MLRLALALPQAQVHPRSSLQARHVRCFGAWAMAARVVQPRAAVLVQLAQVQALELQ